MSHRNYRKLLREKEKHISLLEKKKVEKLNYVSPLTIEEQERKSSRINLFQDLRTACNLELGYGKRYLSYINIQTTDINGKKSTEQVLHPLVNYVSAILSSSRVNFGFLERKAVAHLFETCKRSEIFDDTVKDSSPIDGFEDGYRLKKHAKDAAIAIINMARYKNNWIKNPDLWKCPNAPVEMQIYSIVNYLFVKYPIADFLGNVWTTDDEQNRIYQEWYINLGMGENIRSQRKLPISLTKKVAHYMMQAPKNYNINQAIRYGQIMSIGGNETITNGVNITRLANGFENNEFWMTVIKFFVDNYPFLETHQYGPIYDYINNQKFEPFRFVNENGERIGTPPQPNFSMKGRDPNTLLLNVQRWHNEMNFERIRHDNLQANRKYQIKNEIWESCGIKGLVLKEEEKTYTIMELLTTEELWEEGRTMHHCVASYSSYCVQGNSAIFSLFLKIEDRENKDNYIIERLATLEIRPNSKAIVQARKSMNAKPTSDDMRIISMWAAKVGLDKSRIVN